MQARLEREQLGDEMLPIVGWSWLTEALEQHGAEYVALGGTVTQTSSVRFGDIAGPRRDDDVELRASWTPVGRRISARHAEAFCALVASAAGLPPVGVSCRSSTERLISVLTCEFDAFRDRHCSPGRVDRGSTTL